MSVDIFCRFVVWVDRSFSWVDDSWKKRFNYKEDSLFTKVSLKNPDMRLELQIEDGVHHFHDIFLRKVRIRNAADKEREVRLFFSQDLHLSDTDKDITSYYDPKTDAIVHFKKERYFLMSGSSGEEGLLQFAVGVTEFGKVLTAMVLGNRLMFGSVSSNKAHFEMGVKDMLELRSRYGGVLERLVTKKLHPKDFEQAFEPETEDIKTTICFA